MPTWGWKRMFEAKLTAAQKDEIFERAIFEGESDAALAETYQVSRETIWRVTHDKKRIARKKSTLETMRELAQMRIDAQAERAARKQIELMDRELPDSMIYINQNAATEILDRAGVKRKDEESGEINVRITGGFATKMPKGD